MKWALASIGLLVVIVVFSLAALDQRDVVWAGDTPNCPHCRSVVPWYSSVCPQCQRAFDWQPFETDCELCFSALDMAWYEERWEAAAEARPTKLAERGLSPEQIEAFGEYMDEVRVGACTFCGGTGRWLAPLLTDHLGPEGEIPTLTRTYQELLEEACPVCLGDGRCVLCEGDHRVIHGREPAAMDLKLLRDRLVAIPTARDDASAEAAFAQIAEYVRSYRGRAEVGEVPAFDASVTNGPHVLRARERKKLVCEILDALPR